MNEIHGIARVAVESTIRTRWASRALDALSIGFAALVAGSRSIPLGDNGALLAELAAHAGRARARAVEPSRSAARSKIDDFNVFRTQCFR